MTCSDTSTFPPFSLLFYLFPATQTDFFSSLSHSNQSQPLHSYSQIAKPQKPFSPKTALKPPEPVGHDQDRRCQNAVAEGGAGGGETGATEQAKGQLLLDLWNTQIFQLSSHSSQFSWKISISLATHLKN